MITIGWDGILVIVTVLLACAALLGAVIGWLINRMVDAIQGQIENGRTETARVEAVVHAEVGRLESAIQQREREHLQLIAALPLQYVQREDWIRFSATIDVKLDAIRTELRERRKRDNGND